MKNLYTQALDSIKADEDFKQKIKSSISEYKNLTEKDKAKREKKFSWNMKKLIAVAGAAAVLIFCAILIPVLTMNESTDVAKELNYGFELNTAIDDAAIPKYFCGYKSNTDIFDINDVTMAFYYGSTEVLNKPDIAGKEIKVRLFFENTANSEIVIIKDMNDFYSELYLCSLVISGQVTKIEYNHHEQITIPQEIFTGQSGSIVFAICVYSVDGDLLNDGDYMNAKIFYTVKGKTINLSDKPF